MPILLRTQRLGGPAARPTTRPATNDHLRPASGSMSNALTTSAGGSRRPSQATLPSRPSQDDGLTDIDLSNGHDHGVLMPPPKPTALERIGSYYKILHLNHLIPLVIILVYTLIGAVIFLALEGGGGDGSSEALEAGRPLHPHPQERNILIKRLEEIVEDRSARRRSARRQFLKDALDHYEKETGVLSLNSGQEWTLFSAMYFAGTLFTTIGYGDMACVTAAGRIATVIYSCIGIPLMLITLNDLGKFLYAHINSIVKMCTTALASVKLLRRFLPCLSKAVRDDEIAMQDVEAQYDVDSAKSELGSLPSVEELEEGKQPRMGVVTALSITVGWIFLCAALFGIWEDWSYAESCYFMFISLSTIGLGDVSVERKDLMVLCFVFVIVGLSLVSMSISVVQQAIEDLYVNLIMKLLLDYQENLAQGGDAMGASVGMMRMWGSNRAAKFLMPLLSKEKKRYAMEKVEAEAKQAGIEIPPILTDLDEKTGLPKILNIKEESSPDGPLVIPLELERMVMKQQMNEEEAAMSPLPQVITHTSATQTDTTLCIEKSEQTEEKEMEESGVQTEERPAELAEQTTQTDVVSHEENGFQTERVTVSDAAAATTAVTCTSLEDLTENEQQTDAIHTIDEEVQSYLVEVMDAETEMEPRETKNIRLQTVQPVIVDRDIQSEDLGFEEERKSPSKISSAKRRLKRAFAKRESKRRNSDGDLEYKDSPTEGALNEDYDYNDFEDIVHVEPPSGEEEGEGMVPEEQGADNEDEDEEDGSVESLHWDPVDGMHAEKQLPVKKLTAMFESPKLIERKNMDQPKKKGDRRASKH